MIEIEIEIVPYFYRPDRSTGSLSPWWDISRRQPIGHQVSDLAAVFMDSKESFALLETVKAL